MAICYLCQADTHLHSNGRPICLECADDIDRKSEPQEQQHQQQQGSARGGENKESNATPKKSESVFDVTASL
jgi:hypothetical protein